MFTRSCIRSIIQTYIDKLIMNRMINDCMISCLYHHRKLNLNLKRIFFYIFIIFFLQHLFFNGVEHFILMCCLPFQIFIVLKKINCCKCKMQIQLVGFFIGKIRLLFFCENQNILIIFQWLRLFF